MHEQLRNHGMQECTHIMVHSCREHAHSTQPSLAAHCTCCESVP